MANRDHCNLVELGARFWNEWYLAHPHVMADLSGARFVLRNLAGIVLTGARLNNANLRYADLSNSDLRAAVFTGATVDRANLSGANLAHAIGLSQRQLDNTVGDAKTIIPDNLRRPISWGELPGSYLVAVATPVQSWGRDPEPGIYAAILQRPRS